MAEQLNRMIYDRIYGPRRSQVHPSSMYLEDRSLRGDPDIEREMSREATKENRRAIRQDRDLRNAGLPRPRPRRREHSR